MIPPPSHRSMQPTFLEEASQGSHSCILTSLPDELILCIGQHLVADSPLLYLVNTARTCRKLHTVLLDLVYRAVIEADGRQVLRYPRPELTPIYVLPPVPVVLWAAEHNRLDTMERLWRAQQQAMRESRARAGAGTEGEDALAVTVPVAFVTSAFWYFMPRECQSDPAHMRWRTQIWYEEPWYQERTMGDQDYYFYGIKTGFCTALHMAARHGHDAAVRALVTRYGAHVNATAQQICMCRSRHMRLHICDEAEGEFSRPDWYPIATPLHVALANGHDSTARLLVALGAEWTEKVVPQGPPWGYDRVTGDRVDHRYDGLWWDDPLNHLNEDAAMMMVAAEEDKHDDEKEEEVEGGHDNRSKYTSTSTSRAGHKERQYYDAGDRPYRGVPVPPQQRKFVTNGEHLGWEQQRHEAKLCSRMAQQFQASALQIAAANAMIPFLAWLARTSTTTTTLLGAAGEFHSEYPSDFDRHGALHFAAHAGALIPEVGDEVGADAKGCGTCGNGREDGDLTRESGLGPNGDNNSHDDGGGRGQGRLEPNKLTIEEPESTRGNSREDGDEMEDKETTTVKTEGSPARSTEGNNQDNDATEARDVEIAAGERARMEKLVDCLFDLGVQWPGEGEADIIRYARRWGNVTLAEVLEARRARLPPP